MAHSDIANFLLLLTGGLTKRLSDLSALFKVAARTTLPTLKLRQRTKISCNVSWRRVSRCNTWEWRTSITEHDRTWYAIAHLVDLVISTHPVEPMDTKTTSIFELLNLWMKQRLVDLRFESCVDPLAPADQGGHDATGPQLREGFHSQGVPPNAGWFIEENPPINGG